MRVRAPDIFPLAVSRREIWPSFCKLWSGFGSEIAFLQPSALVSGVFGVHGRPCFMSVTFQIVANRGTGIGSFFQKSCVIMRFHESDIQNLKFSR